MNAKRLVGVLLLIAGIVLIIIGIAGSRSFADTLSSFIRGYFTQNTMRYLFGGIAVAVVGLLLTLGIVGRSRS